MKVLGEYVLVEQTDTKKKTLIHLPGASEKQGYTTAFKVMEIGSGVPKDYGLEVGDQPIFNNDVTFQGMKVTSPKEEKNVMTALTMIHYMDIIAKE